eukprot:1836072-Rhodomonas_salina.1
MSGTYTRYAATVGDASAQYLVVPFSPPFSPSPPFPPSSHPFSLLPSLPPSRPPPYIPPSLSYYHDRLPQYCSRAQYSAVCTALRYQGASLVAGEVTLPQLTPDPRKGGPRYAISGTDLA